MLRNFSDKRIRIRLLAIADGEPCLASVEERERAFASYVRNVIMVLDRSPLGRLLVRSAMLHHVSVGLDPLLEPDSSIFYPTVNHFDLGYQPALVQKTEKGLSRYLTSFLHALRRSWHYHSGRGPDFSLKPEDFLKLSRCEEADVVAAAHLAAWELRSAGVPFLWRHFLSDADGDIAVVFEHCVADNPQNQFNGIALKAAFNQWFAEKERIAACDHFALEMLDAALVQRPLQRGLGSETLRQTAIEGIGVMPNGLNYLAGSQLSGPWYEGLDDEFNRIHLQHIQEDMRHLPGAADIERQNR